VISGVLVFVCVRALKGKRGSYQPNLVHIYLAGRRHALTWLEKVKGQDRVVIKSAAGVGMQFDITASRGIKFLSTFEMASTTLFHKYAYGYSSCDVSHAVG